MKQYKWIIILVNLLIFIGIFNQSIFHKEAILAEGQLVLLELAPVDPRSLMQGDFMSLSYDISNNINYDTISKRGFCVVKIQEDGIAQKIRLQSQHTPLDSSEVLIEYTSNGLNNLNIGAESYFFQEGKGEKYEKAKYGGLKVDDKGNSILIGLFDEDQKKI